MDRVVGFCGGMKDWFVADGSGGLRGLKNSLAASECRWRISCCVATAFLYT